MAVYVYSVVSADHPLHLEGLTGVGPEPTPLRSVTADGLAAVVSDAPPDLRPKRRDLAVHQDVQERLMADGTVLPLQFGMTAADDDLVEQALLQGADRYRDRLRALRGCAEYHLRGSEEEESVLRRILTESPEAWRLNESIRAGRGGPDDPVALGEIVAGEVAARREALAAAVTGALRAHAREERPGTAGGDDFLSTSFLVAEEKADDLRAAVEELAAELGDTVTLNLRGPLPPYSFT